MNKKRKLIETSVNDIPTKQIGGYKYYVDSTPEKKTMSAGDYDTDGYTTHISPDEFESMQDYDDSLGYDYEPGNEEPICYDPIDGPCYDSGDYYSKDLPLQRDYAKYRHHMSDMPRYEKKQQMDNDWSKYHNPNEITNMAYLDSNLNTFDNKGKMSMMALSDEEPWSTQARAQTGSTLRGWFDNMKNESYKGRTNKLRLTESQLHSLIKESVQRITERIKGERGMTDDEVMHRRNTNFKKDMDYVPNRLQDDPYTPNYSDKQEREAMYHTPEEMELKVAHDRMRAHKAGQRHKSDNNVHKVRFTESQFHSLIKESVRQMLSELDWKTYANAAKKRHDQYERLSKQPYMRNFASDYADKSHELLKHAEKAFNQKHGKNGYPYQYEGDSPAYQGRYTYNGLHNSEDDFEVKNPSQPGWWNGEKADGISHYRYGKGIPDINQGRIHDDMLDLAYNDKEGWTGERKPHMTTIIDKDGERVDGHTSHQFDEYFRDSKDKDYRQAMDDMTDDMANYYQGKSKYIKGKGWQ